MSSKTGKVIEPDFFEKNLVSGIFMTGGPKMGLE